MSESESDPEESFSEPEEEESSHTVNKSKPPYPQLGGAFDPDNADATDEDADTYEKPKIKIGEEIINVVDSDDDEEDDLDGLSEQDSDTDNTLDTTREFNNSMTQQELLSDSEDEDDEEVDDDYLKRFDRELINNHIELYHPESSVHNYDEVRTLSRVTKDKNGVVNDNNHKTLPFLTKFEKSKILGLRAKQLDEGAQPFVKVMPNIVTGYTIASLELIQKKIPFIIRRPIPNGTSEYWKVSDLEIII